MYKSAAKTKGIGPFTRRIWMKKTSNYPDETITKEIKREKWIKDIIFFPFSSSLRSHLSNQILCMNIIKIGFLVQIKPRYYVVLHAMYRNRSLPISISFIDRDSCVNKILIEFRRLVDFKLWVSFHRKVDDHSDLT